MKELTRFRQFLAEGEAKGFTFIFKKGEKGKEQIKKPKKSLKIKILALQAKETWHSASQLHKIKKM